MDAYYFERRINKLIKKQKLLRIIPITKIILLICVPVKLGTTREAINTKPKLANISEARFNWSLFNFIFRFKTNKVLLDLYSI